MVAWSVVVICLPRMYFGYHYPSDVLSGAVLGMAVMAVALTVRVPRPLLAVWERAQRQAPGALQAAQFAIALQVTDNFDNIRAILSGLKVV